MTREMNVLALVKDVDDDGLRGERFIFLYDEESADSVLQMLGKFAADRSLNFNWYDAAVLSQKVRRLKEEAEAEARENWLRETTW